MSEPHRIDLAGDLSALTGLRGVAAMWVFLFHVWGLAGPRAMNLELAGFSVPFSPLFGGGWAGVDIFFSLSAFLLGLPFALAHAGQRPMPTLGEYFRRRTLRILPAYYAQFLLLVLLAAAVGGAALPPIRVWLAHALLWLNLGPDPVAPLNGVWWTLPTEFSFYLLLPLLATRLRVGQMVWLVPLAVVLTTGFRLLMFSWVGDLDVPHRVMGLEQLPGRLDQFVIGMATAYVAVALADRPPEWLRRAATLMMLVGTAGLVALCYALASVVDTYWDGHPLLFCWHALASLCIALMILGGAFAGAWIRVLLANRLALWVGTVSYSFYLWHLPLSQEIFKRWFASDTDYTFPRLFPVCAIAVLLLASLSYLLIERPCLRLAHRRRAPAATVGVPIPR